MIRVVHIATVDCEGGAARSAFRLHQGLLAAGQASQMVVQKKSSQDDSVLAVTDPPWVESEDAFLWDLIQKYYVEHQRTGLSNSYFSVGYPGRPLNSVPAIQAADLLHLHWVAGFQSVPALTALITLGKPVVWTLHDQRPFTGGCHFSAGCTQYQSDCAQCPQLKTDPLHLTRANLADQMDLWQAQKITTVGPSRWMAECARHSSVFRHAQVACIPYGIDTQSYHPGDRTRIRAEYNIDNNVSCFLFGADFGAEKRKGFAELAGAFQRCQNTPRFQQAIRTGQALLLAFGRPSPLVEKTGLPVRWLGYLRTDEELRRAYVAADYFLLPSLEDNLPNTLLESLSCGTPVIAFNVGGIPDFIAENKTGRLVPAGSSEAFAEAILSALKTPLDSDRLRAGCRERIEADGSLSAQAQSYLALYRELLASSASNSTLPSNSRDTCQAAGRHLAKIHPELVEQSLRQFRRRLKWHCLKERTVGQRLIRQLNQAIPAGTAAEAMNSATFRQLLGELIRLEQERKARQTQRRAHRQAHAAADVR
jgi:glycosyltransferase involved in cell wall biosynthesis